MIGKLFILSYHFGASNTIFKQDMMNVLYHVSLSWPSNIRKSHRTRKWIFLWN